MCKLLLGALAVAAFASAAASPAALADFNDNKPITATVTGATPTGYPRLMVEGLNAIVRGAYPGSAVSLKPNSPGGGLLAVTTKEADFTATATGTEIRLGNEGKAPYKTSLKGKFLYVMMLSDAQYVHFVMSKAWADENGIRTWTDIATKKPKIRLAINRIDNPQVTIGAPYEVMKVHGFSIDDIPKWGGSFILGNSQIGLDAMKDGKADIFMNARNPGDAQIKEIHSNRPLLWIDGDPEKIREAAATYSSVMHMLPKGTYPFFDKDYPTIRQWASLVAGAHVSDEVVYKYVKAIAENDAAVRKIGGAMGKFDTKLMIRNPANLPFHPGALRYYREKGWVK